MTFSIEQLKQKLSDFRKLTKETEWLEFKEAKDDFSFEKLGQYFSALSNETHLQSVEYGWLILGIENTEKILLAHRIEKVLRWKN